MRLIFVVGSLLVMSLVIFGVTEVLPGDVAHMILGQQATPRDLENVRRDLGLDRPAPVRYVEWFGGALRGDFGDSLFQQRPIVDIVKSRLWNSAILGVFAIVLSIPPAVISGVLAGVYRNTRGDYLMSVLGLVAVSLPQFVIGLLLIIVFSSTLGLLPSSSVVLPGTNPLTRPSIMVLPTLTLSTGFFAYIMRMTRANVIEVMEMNYVRTAILSGLPMRQVVLRHVFPNAMLPTISIIAMTVGWMIGGLIIVEYVFAFPGIGELLLRAIQTRDVPLLQAVALLVAATYAISNLVADVIYAAMNPRIRLG